MRLTNLSDGTQRATGAVSSQAKYLRCHGVGCKGTRGLGLHPCSTAVLLVGDKGQPSPQSDAPHRWGPGEFGVRWPQFLFRLASDLENGFVMPKTTERPRVGHAC